MRLAGHINVSGWVQCDRGGGIVRHAAKISCVDQGGACAVQLGEKPVVGTAAVILLKRSRRGGEIDGCRVAGNMRLTGRIHCDSGAVIIAAAAQKSRVQQCVAAGVQFQDESFAATHEVSAECPVGSGEIRRIREACDIGVAGRIHRYP